MHLLKFLNLCFCGQALDLGLDTPFSSFDLAYNFNKEVLCVKIYKISFVIDTPKIEDFFVVKFPFTALFSKIENQDVYFYGFKFDNSRNAYLFLGIKLGQYFGINKPNIMSEMKFKRDFKQKKYRQHTELEIELKKDEFEEIFEPHDANACYTLMFSDVNTTSVMDYKVYYSNIIKQNSLWFLNMELEMEIFYLITVAMTILYQCALFIKKKKMEETANA